MDLEYLNYKNTKVHDESESESYEEITQCPVAEIETSDNYSAEGYVINNASGMDGGSIENTDSDTCISPLEASNADERSYTEHQNGFDTPENKPPFIDESNVDETNTDDIGKTFENNETPYLDDVTVINNEITSNDIFSSKMTVREKINWLEKRVHELKNMIGGHEVWMLSKEGHAMKVKCVLTTNELPECKGTGRKSIIKFLRQMRETLISSGVTENDWVKLASSRLRGDFKTAWESKYKNSSSIDWAEFSNFILCLIDSKRKIRREEKCILKKRYSSIEDIIVKRKREFE